MSEEGLEKAQKNYIEIEENAVGIPKHLLSIPLHYREDIEKVLVPYGLILDRTEKLATDIFNEFGNEPIVCLCVLKGGFKFFSDLTERIQTKNRINGKKSLPMMIDFIRLKSYQNTESQGEVQIIGCTDMSHIKGKNVLIVEDMIDTGKTMQKLLHTLDKYEPKNVRVCCLLVKRTEKSSGYIPDYIGFSIPEEYIVGYATDLNEHFRDLEHICVINPSSIHKYTI